MILTKLPTQFHVYPFSDPISILSSDTLILLVVTKVWFALRYFKSGKLQEIG